MNITIVTKKITVYKVADISHLLRGQAYSYIDPKTDIEYQTWSDVCLLGTAFQYSTTSMSSYKDHSLVENKYTNKYNDCDLFMESLGFKINNEKFIKLTAENTELWQIVFTIHTHRGYWGDYSVSKKSYEVFSKSQQGAYMKALEYLEQDGLYSPHNNKQSITWFVNHLDKLSE